jgi:hypothetical protein
MDSSPSSVTLSPTHFVPVSWPVFLLGPLDWILLPILAFEPEMLRPVYPDVFMTLAIAMQVIWVNKYTQREKIKYNSKVAGELKTICSKLFFFTHLFSSDKRTVYQPVS